MLIMFLCFRSKQKPKSLTQSFVRAEASEVVNPTSEVVALPSSSLEVVAQEFTEGRNFCPGCFYMSKQLSANISNNHNPAECPRKVAIVQMLDAEDQHLTGPNNEAGKSQPHSAKTERNIDPRVKVIPTKVILAASSQNLVQFSSILSNYEYKSVLMINYISECVIYALSV